jgi:hypothetical protein
MRTPEGQEYGPSSRADIDRWVSEGRVTADCQLREGEFGVWQSADQVFSALKPAAPVWTQPSPYAPSSPATGSPFADRPSDPYLPPAAASGLYAPGTSYQAPHRGALILVLGLLGFAVCFIFSIMAWVMGSNDLREMEAGRMDRSGMDLTRAGMILGMIVSVLAILSVLAAFGLIFLGAIAG